MQRTAPLLLLSICLSSISQAALADDLPPAAIQAERASVWINPGFLSHHFDQSKGFREYNYGSGIQVNLSSTNSIIGGEYQNSDNAHSSYLGWIWQPYQAGIARFGIWAGGINGYPAMQNGGWFLVAFPVVSLEYKAVGVNFTVFPNYQEKVYGGIVVQLKLRVWEQ
jgi:hypothetical protein